MFLNSRTSESILSYFELTLNRVRCGSRSSGIQASFSFQLPNVLSGFCMTFKTFIISALLLYSLQFSHKSWKESLRKFGHILTDSQFNRSEELVLRRMDYRLDVSLRLKTNPILSILNFMIKHFSGTPFFTVQNC